MNQKKSKHLELTADELARIEQTRQRAERIKVGLEEYFVAEFGYYYGWQGVMAILDNTIDIETANKLLRGAQKVWYGKVVDQAYGTYTATAAVHSGKKAKQVMNKGLKNFIKEARVDI